MAETELGWADDGLGLLPDWDNAADDELIGFGGPIPHVVHVEAVAPLTLHVRFDDGVEGPVRFLPSHLRGVFEVLKDPEYFRQVGIVYGVVSWPNEMPDLAPDAMHDEIAAKGEWVLV